MEQIRVLIADDHAILRDTLCRLLSLEPEFLVVGQVESGLLVMEAIRRYQPDILLLDLNMPGLGGLATLQQLHEADYKTRVILLTGSDSEADFAKARRLGSCSVVQKQAGAEVLFTSIRLVHRHQVEKV
jgi:DNA-binding NarL/FixJ family response regulator